MKNSVSLGIHFATDRLRVAYVEGDQLMRIDAIDLSEKGHYFSWCCPQSDTLEFFTALDLLTVDPIQAKRIGKRPDETLRHAIKQALEQVASQNLTVTRCAVAASVTLQELDRRHLLSLVTKEIANVSLVDSTAAALHALQSQIGQDESRVAVVVAEDRALEITVAHVTPKVCEVLAQASVEELSGRALNHYLLQLVFDRLSDEHRSLVAKADAGLLDELLRRLVKSRSMLGRIQELRFPLRQIDQSTAVTLRQEDVSNFFDRRQAALESAVEDLQSQTDIGQIEQLLLVGDFGDFAIFAEQLESLLGPVEVSSFSLLADGAALAALGENPPSTSLEDPPYMSFASFLQQSSQPLNVKGAADVTVNPEEAVQQLFSQVKGLLAEDRHEEAREIAMRVKAWSERLMAGLSDDDDPSRPQADSKTDAPTNDASKRTLPASTSAESSRANRYLADAERHLDAARILEAVACSHRAHEAAREDHDVLMAMLDIHRRAAAALSGPKNFEAAVLQLRCALQHRQNDSATCEALANRLVEHGLHLEKQSQFEAALNLFNDASVLTDDDSIMDHIERLENQVGSL